MLKLFCVCLCFSVVNNMFVCRQTPSLLLLWLLLDLYKMTQVSHALTVFSLLLVLLSLLLTRIKSVLV